MVQANKKHIHFHFLTPAFFFPKRTAVKNFLGKLITKEGRKIDTVNYIFCTDEYLLALNKSHLNHNSYTDILTFEHSHPGAPLIADIYISAERVKENAQKYHCSFKKELLRVIFHGTLHLCGFDDKSREQVQLMREREDFYLKKYFVSRETWL